MWTAPASRPWGSGTRWCPGCSAATPGCARSASGRPTRPPPGPSSASASAFARPPRSSPGWPSSSGSRAPSATTPFLPSPAPQQLATLDAFPGLSGRKPEWLRALGRAALDGRLDTARLRARPYDQALAALTELPGIGPFAAELVLLRGAGDPDHIPAHETRLARAVALAYGLSSPPSVADLVKLSENWRPYRTWVTLLVRAQLEDETGEISGVRHRNT